MKVAIGTRVRSGPWGGGNQFAAAFARFLEERGVTVSYDLTAPDLDVILLTEPRRSSATSAFNDVDILRYLSEVNPSALVVHRINECDERKNTRLLNRRLEIANRCADRTVFISEWLQRLFSRRGGRFAPGMVIRNGADRELFARTSPRWDGREPLRVVTHHWSGNWMKGFDIYQRLDELLGHAEYAAAYSFTYIGQLPAGFQFRNVRVEPPATGAALAQLLQQHHVYLTASRHEPAGMHHIEGALCGLPLLYLESGALPEYCEGFGLAFDENSFEAQLAAMRSAYQGLKTRMSEYPYDSSRMCEGYWALFSELYRTREAIAAQRAWRRRHALGMMARASLYDAWYGWRLRLAR